MRPWITRVPAVAVALSAGLVLGNAAGGLHPGPGPAALVLSPRQGATLFSYPTGRAHPEGPDADDVATRARPLYPASTPLWIGNGRHPVWRGCQHVYDPRPPSLGPRRATGSR